MNESARPSTVGVFKPVGYTLIGFHTESELQSAVKALRALGFADDSMVQFCDHVFPRLPVRQWVPSVPKRLRYFMQRDGAVLSRRDLTLLSSRHPTLTIKTTDLLISKCKFYLKR